MQIACSKFQNLASIRIIQSRDVQIFQVFSSAESKGEPYVFSPMSTPQTITALVSRWRRKRWSSAQSSILLDIHFHWVCDHQFHQNLRKNQKSTRPWSWSFSTEVQTLSICWFPWTALSMMNTEMSVSVLPWIQLHCTRSTLLASPALSLGSIQNWMSSRSCTTAMNLLLQQMLDH